MKPLTGPIVGVGLILACAVQQAAALSVQVDAFRVEKNDALLFVDDFEDSMPPPSAPDFSSGGPATYLVAGTPGPEEGGKLTLDSAAAELSPTTGIGQVYARLATNASSDAADMGLGLKSDDTFSVTAVFDLVSPGFPGEGYGIRFTDERPGAVSNDVARLVVRRSDAGTPMVQFLGGGSPQGTGTAVLAELSLEEDHDQIAFTLTRQDIQTGEVTASFSYIDGGVAGPVNTLGAEDLLFSDEVFTRAQITAFTGPPGKLGVSPREFEPRGGPGGPFIPTAQTYLLSNSGAMPLGFGVATDVGWLDLEPEVGTLNPGESAVVTARLNSHAQFLGVGSYPARLEFNNQTNPADQTVLTATLNVVAEGRLAVFPPVSFNALGKEGGDGFQPASKNYVLRNPGLAELSFSAATDVDWLDIQPVSGVLAPQTATSVTVSVAPGAAALQPGVLHEAEISFTNTTTGLGSTARRATLVLIPAANAWSIVQGVGFDDPTSMAVKGLGNGETASLKMTLDRSAELARGPGIKQTDAPAQIGFQVMTSTEESADVLTFSIDGVPVGQWSGESDWSSESFELPPPGLSGETELEWTYGKNGQGSGGDDAVYVDVIEILDDVQLASSVLPSSRSGQVGETVTAFATLVNAGSAEGADCEIATPDSLPATMHYQTTDPASNLPTGLSDSPVNLSAGGAQSFVISIEPSEPMDATDIAFIFDCVNSTQAAVTAGLNTLILSASSEPVPDIVALAATLSGDGVVAIPGTGSTGVFSVASVNLGSAGILSVEAHSGAADLPLLISLCQTEPATGECRQPPAASVITEIDGGGTPTFGVFVTAEDELTFDPAAHRVFVRFIDQTDTVRGATSVAVRTD